MTLQASEGGVREAILSALKGVIKHAGKSLSDAVRTRVYAILKDLIHQDDEQVRISAASILGITSQVRCFIYLFFYSLFRLFFRLIPSGISTAYPFVILVIYFQFLLTCFSFKIAAHERRST